MEKQRRTVANVLANLFGALVSPVRNTEWLGASGASQIFCPDPNNRQIMLAHQFFGMASIGRYPNSPLAPYNIAGRVTVL